MNAFEIRHGHVLDRLREMAEESVHCCVTSPPYWGLRSYGTPDQVWGGDSSHVHVWGGSIQVNATNHTDKRRWNHTCNGRGEYQPDEKLVDSQPTKVDQGSFCECGAWRGSLGLEPTPQLYVEHVVEVFREVRRVLKGDGTCWLNLGDSYCNTDKWGGGKSGNTGKHTKDADGGCPSWTVRRKRDAIPGLKPKDLIGIPWRVAFALQEDGWWLRSDIIWAKPAPMPESITDRPTRSHEYVFLLAKNQRYFYDHEAIKEPSVCGHSSGNGYKRDSRLTYSDDNGARGSDRPWMPPVISDGRKELHGPTYSRHRASIEGGQSLQAAPDGKRNRRDVWTLSTLPTPDAHFATFPIELPEICILAGSAPGGLILDPFCGAGTTGLAALKHGRRFIGLELNQEYIAISNDRLNRHCPLFGQAQVTHEGSQEVIPEELSV